MRQLWAILLVSALGACALSPGQLDAIKIDAMQSCVNVVIIGDPMAGQSTATATIPVSGLPGGLGAAARFGATDMSAPQLPGNAVTVGPCRP